MTDEMEQPPASLLPYEQWAEEAQRHVMLRALSHVVAHGLPGEHHFYITFRTDYPGTVIPDRMRAQYPHEMTIVLQHQFWDLKVDDAAKLVSVGLSFGGVATTLRIPFGAVTQFVDRTGHAAARRTAGGQGATEPGRRAGSDPRTKRLREEARRGAIAGCQP
jgi:hypothetical protein